MGGGGEVSRVARAVSKATEVTPVKWYQGKELFLWPAVLSLTKKSRWQGCTCILNTLLLHCSQLRCLCFTWGGLRRANWPLGHSTPEVLEDALEPLVHNVLWRETDGAVPQVQAFEGNHISWEKLTNKEFHRTMITGYKNMQKHVEPYCVLFRLITTSY